MSTGQYQLIFKEKASSGPVMRQTCDGETRMAVREITTRTLLQLRACDISIYRHTLLLDDKPYDILSVFPLQ